MQLTPMERIIYDATEDGKYHTPEELMLLLDLKPEEPSDKNALYQVLARVRRKLPEIGQDIIGQYSNRKVKYIRVRLLESALKAGTSGS